MRAGMAGNPTRLVNIDHLREVTQRLLQAAGCDPDVAATVADIHVEAELRGHSLQGLDHVVFYLVRAMKAGRVKPNGRPRIVREGEASLLVDGDWGPGQLHAVFAADQAAPRARKAGCCTVGIVNSNDIYYVGYYVERLARQGLVGILFTDAVPNSHPFGGADRLMGANVMAVAVPSAGPHPVLLDFATTHTFLSRTGVYARAGLPLPEGWGADADGVPTTDPAKVLDGGAVSPISGHKGYGLSLCIALLSGALVGGAMGPGLGRSVYSGDLLPSGDIAPDWLERLGEDRFGPRGSKGHLLIAIDPAALGDPEEFRRSVTEYLEQIKGSRRAPGLEEILAPGERSFTEREKNLREGTVAVEEHAWAGAVALAAALGVPMPG